MRFEISNPHDECFMESETFAAGLAAIAILGQGLYGLNPIDEPTVPTVHPILFGDWSDEVYLAAGVNPPNAAGLCDWMNASAANNEAVAKAFDSVKLAHSRTSMTDMEKRARKLAEAMRGKRAFAGAERK